MQTVVINNKEALVQGQLQPTMRNAQGAPVVGKCVTLLPGANLVASAEVEELLKNPQFKACFTTKIPYSKAPEQNPEKVGQPILEFLEVDAGKDGGKKPLQVEDSAPLAKLKPEVVKVLVDEVLAASILRGWLREEVRPDVAHLLNLRIARLEGAPEGGPATAGQ